MKREREADVNKIYVKTYLLKLGFALCKNKIVADHSKNLECRTHNCIVDAKHLSTCSHFKIDFQTIEMIKEDIRKGKYKLTKYSLPKLMNNLENIHSKIIDATVKKLIVPIEKSDDPTV